MRDNVMTIEDFFTLIKLEDGFTDPAQVKELFAIIVQEDDNKDSVAIDISIHQWYTIARAIITTNNKECLDAFAQLDKLRYIDKSLLNAQKVGTETGDPLVENLLQVLDKLQIDKHNLIPSGIWTTVKNIAQNNSNSVIQEMAKALVFDKWKEEVKNDLVFVQDIAMAACVNEKGLNDGESSAEHLLDQQKLLHVETPENSLNHAMTIKDTEQILNGSDKLIVATLEQKVETPKSATDLTNVASHSDAVHTEEDIETKDPCVYKDSVHCSDSLQDSGVVGEVIEQVNGGAENDCDGAEIAVSPQHGSPDTTKGEEDRDTGGSQNKTQVGSNGSTETSPIAEEPGNWIQELYSPSAVTCQEDNIDKVNGSGSLDLNQQVSSEDKEADILLKQQGGFVGIDLNLASDNEHIIIERQSEPRQIVTSSKYTHLDLNRMCDDDSDNIIQSHSPSSASSSKSFDLNDLPFIKNTDDVRVIKIMGTHVKLDTQKFIPQTLSLAQASIPNPGTTSALGSETSYYVDLLPEIAAFYGSDASTIPCTGSSSASTVLPCMSNGITVDLNSDPEMMDEGVNACTTAGLFANGRGNDYFRGTKRKIADSQWDH